MAGAAGLEPAGSDLESDRFPVNGRPYKMYYITMIEIIPQLNKKQLDRLSEFLSNFSLLIIATLVLPNIIGDDKPNMNNLGSR